MRRVLFMIMLAVTLLTACVPAAATQQPTSDAPSAPTQIPVDLTPAQRAALAALSEQLGVSVNELEIVSTEAVTWPDGCLGIVKPGVMCTQAEVEGFRIVLEANGQEYELRTNQDGRVALFAQTALEAGDLEQMVIEQLASNLGLDKSAISLRSSVEVEFEDACLGVAQEGVLCAQVVTPGRMIVLEADGVDYEYHTSADGSRVQPATTALIWKREGGIAGFCDALTVFRSGEVYTSNCKSQGEGAMGTLADLLSVREREQFRDWIIDFDEAEVDASDPAGVSDQMVITLEFNGAGDHAPTTAEQQDLLQFAEDLYRQLRR